MKIIRAEDRRYPPPAEAAAYFAIEEAIRAAARRGADHAAVGVGYEGGRLVITVQHNGVGDASPMMAAADRIGALGGSLSIRKTMCRAEIPCASS